MIRNHKGMSFVEIVVILCIIAGVLFLAVPNYVASIRETKEETDQIAATMIADVARRVIYLNEEFQGLNITGLDLSQMGSKTQVSETDPLINEFEKELWVQLLETVPKPVYKQYPVTVENFILSIESGREIYVYVGMGTDVSKEMSVRIYPEVDLDYGR